MGHKCPSAWSVSLAGQSGQPGRSAWSISLVGQPGGWLAWPAPGSHVRPSREAWLVSLAGQPGRSALSVSLASLELNP